MIEEELLRITREGLPQSEVDKAKNRYELSFLHGMETAAGKAEQIGFYETVLGDARHVFAHLDAVRAVTPVAVQTAIARLTPERRTTLFVDPAGDTEGESS